MTRSQGLICLVVLSLIVALVSLGSSQSTSPSLEELQTAVASLQQRVRRIEQQLGFVAELAPASTPESPTTRNPFGLPDVRDPDGADVIAFARSTDLAGDDKDPNALQWVSLATGGAADSLSGAWFGRWNWAGSSTWVYGIGQAELREVGERVYIRFVDHQGRFLIDLRREKNRLMGRWQAIDNPSDTGPCVFRIVDSERIDGTWAGRGRWDFRRKLK